MLPCAKATNELSFSNQESSFRTLFGVPNEAKSSMKKISPLTDLKKNTFHLIYNTLQIAKMNL
jgi:hypothetical protein